MDFEFYAGKIAAAFIMIFSIAMTRLIPPSLTKFCRWHGRELVEHDEPPSNLDNSG